ncbi:MAG TPA: hypothetical protein VKA82_08880, partial [Rubrobacter sp.]|nr:hypothetical protein [Rubrobacter sp.]
MSNRDPLALRFARLNRVLAGLSATFLRAEPPGIMGSMSDPEQLVRAAAAAGVGDPRVLDAVRTVPRAGFVPPHLAGRAYRDEPLPIPHGQVTTQPSLAARMVEA